jgi:hypothetical protein
MDRLTSSLHIQGFRQVRESLGELSAPAQDYNYENDRQATREVRDIIIGKAPKVVRI